MIFVVVLVLLANCVTVFAHSASLRGYFDGQLRISGAYFVGSEEIGWIVDDTEHTNGTSTDYKFSASMSNRFKALFAEAANLWNFTPFTIRESSSSSNIIYIKSDSDFPDEGISAMLTNRVKGTGTNSSHLTSWEIWINNAYWDYFDDDSKWVTILAHELGHVWGLTDLYENYNTSKLMYYAGDLTTSTGPTLSDKWGARVITGHHTNHTFNKTLGNHTCTRCGGVGTHSTSNYTYSPTNASVHTINVCSVCNYSYTESHVAYYNQLLGRCSKCGYTGLIVLGLGNEIE